MVRQAYRMLALSAKEGIKRETYAMVLEAAASREVPRDDSCSIMPPRPRKDAGDKCGGVGTLQVKTPRAAWLFHRVDQEDHGSILEEQWVRHSRDMHEQMGPKVAGPYQRSQPHPSQCALSPTLGGEADAQDRRHVRKEGPSLLRSL